MSSIRFSFSAAKTRCLELSCEDWDVLSYTNKPSQGVQYAYLIPMKGCSYKGGQSNVGIMLGLLQ